MNYTEAVEYIEQLKGWGAQMGLDRMRMILFKLGDPQKELKFVHIAGSNGKGSNSAMLESVLRAAGYKTGLFTSPHLIKWNERFKINGVVMSDDDFVEATQALKDVCDTLSEEDQPTVFERMTLMGMWYFAQKKCDIVVLEVGMGGIRDATNVIDSPEVALIAHLALEHVKVLGNTIEEIAANKAGIIKPGCNVVLLNQLPEAEAVVKAKAAECGCKIVVTDPSKRRVHRSDLTGQCFDYRDRKDLELNLLGEYQSNNVMTALDSIDALIERGWNIPEEAIRKGLANVFWPARFQLVYKKPLILLDGAHNSDGVRELRKSLESAAPGKKIDFIMGVLNTKDYELMLEIIAPIAKSFIAVSPSEHKEKTLSSAELASIIERIAPDVPVDDAEDVIDGIKLASRRWLPGDIICVFGSLYQTGDVLQYFGLDA